MLRCQLNDFLVIHDLIPIKWKLQPLIFEASGIIKKK